MTRLQGILAAGGLTSIVLVAAVAMGFRNTVQAFVPTTAPVIAPASQQQTSQTIDPATLATLQEYQAQIDQANQTIQQLQAERDWLVQQLAAAQTVRSGERVREFGASDD